MITIISILESHPYYKSFITFIFFEGYDYTITSKFFKIETKNKKELKALKKFLQTRQIEIKEEVTNNG